MKKITLYLHDSTEGRKRTDRAHAALYRACKRCRSYNQGTLDEYTIYVFGSVQDPEDCEDRTLEFLSAWGCNRKAPLSAIKEALQ